MQYVSEKVVRLWILVAIVVAGQWVLAAQAPPTPALLLQAADAFMANLRYQDALVAYRAARQTDDTVLRIRAGAGAVRALLRVGMFTAAQREGELIAKADPQQAAAGAINGDALWAAGLFPEAEDRYAAALALDSHEPRALHGVGRSLAARQRLDEALADLARAVSIDPREPMYQYSLGMTYVQLRRYEEAASALTRYADLLSKHDLDLMRSARTQAKFLRSFGKRTPFEMLSGDAEVYTVPFRTVDDQMIVSGRVNGTSVDMVVDTGVEHAVISPAIAERAGVKAVATLDTAGVGDFGFGIRGMQIARLDRLEVGTLRVNNVTCLIASPSLPEMPSPETETFSPLALGLSMTIDYRRGVLTMARQLPEHAYEITLPLRMARLPIVRGLVNGSSPVSFVLDTGSQDTSLGRSVVAQLNTDPAVRHVPVKVYGRGGWDRSAFLLPYVDVELASGAGLRKTSVIVLSLDAPSALLGFQVGGVIGHGFLSQYAVAIDLQRSQVGLQRQPATGSSGGAPGRPPSASSASRMPKS
jgi:tetratricopeptide (TPR) repeat protein